MTAASIMAFMLSPRPPAKDGVTPGQWDRSELGESYFPADALRNRMMSARSSAFGRWNLISLLGTNDSVSVSHLSNETSSHVTCADFKASEYLKVEMLPAVRP
jgi:hypothetical protein